jgi:hypothetical protein
MEQTKMIKWFNIREKKECIGYIRWIYIKPFVIVLEMDCINDRFYSIIYNTVNSTTFYKVNCVRGNYGSPIEIERITIRLTPYKYT